MASCSSRKSASSLTYGAALGACVSFAAQVLGSDAPVGHVCTKDALGPIVREAHRVGLHAARLWTTTDSTSAVADPRKLLKRLQTHPDVGIELIDSLAFKDLTWDSHGDVAETLEMELLELEMRATETGAGVCVLLTLHAGSTDAPASPEAAILWLPASDCESSSSRDRKKQSLLLYVCPGRVKAVKSVPEVLKKLREECTLMLDHSASYRIWTLVRGPSRHRKKTPSSQARENEGQRESPLMPNPSVTETTAQQPRKVAIQPMEEDTRVLSTSIFSFPTAPHIANREESVAEAASADANLPVPLDGPTGMLVDAPAHSKSSPVETPESSRTISSPRRRLTVSSSYSSRVPTTLTPAIARNEAMWASVDSDLRRPRLRHVTVKEEGSEANECRRALDPVAGEDHTETQTTDSGTAVPSSLSASHYTTQQQLKTKGVLNASVRVANASEASIFSFLRDPIHDKGRRVAECELLSEHTACASGELTPNEEQSNGGSVSHASDAADGGSTEEADTVSTTQVCQVALGQAPVPARKNYRAKLGNRVWWELRCTAERLQQQQAGESAARPQSGAVPTRSQRELMEQPPIGLCATDSTERETPLATAVDPRVAGRNSLLQTVRVEGKAPSAKGSPSARQILSTPLDKDLRLVERAEKQCVANSTKIGSRSGDMAILKGHKTTSVQPVECAPTYISASSATLHDVSEQSLRGRDDLADAGTSAGVLLRPTSCLHEQSPCVDTSTVTAALPDVAYSDTKDHHPAFSIHTDGRRRKSPLAGSGTRERLMSSTTTETGVLDLDAEVDDVELIRSHSTNSRISDEARRERSHPHPQEPRDDPEHRSGSAERVAVFGGVPMRSRRYSELSTMQRPEVEADSSSTDEDTAIASPTKTSVKQQQRTTARGDTRLATAVAHQKGSDLAPPFTGDKRVQYEATFIAGGSETETTGKLESGRGPFSTDRQPVCEEKKVAELRRKKLQQLYRAREQQQLHQQKKQLERTNLTLAPPSNNNELDNLLGGGPPMVFGKKAAKRPSNKRLVQNALEFTLLAGGSMAKDRRAALAALALSPCDNFIVLLKSAKDLKFRALYEHHSNREEVSRLFAAAPNCPLVLAGDAIGQFFKYNSGKKEFVAIDSRAFTVKTDACALKDELVFKKKVGLGRLL